MTDDDRTTTLLGRRPEGIGPKFGPPTLLGVGDVAPARFVIAGREQVVGRGGSCALRIAARGVSRQHAKLVLSPGAAVSLIDLGSRNGTFVNGARVDAATLDNGDEIYFGPVAAFRFVRLPVVGTSPALDVLRRLSPREQSVAVLVAEGLTNAGIASQLGIRSRTVATHLEHVFVKLGLRSRAELVRRVVEAGAVMGARG